MSPNHIYFLKINQIMFRGKEMTNLVTVLTAEMQSFILILSSLHSSSSFRVLQLSVCWTQKPVSLT